MLEQRGFQAPGTHGRSALEHSKLERLTARSFRDGLSRGSTALQCERVQRQHLSAHAAISACRSWRRSNLETPRCGAALDGSATSPQLDSRRALLPAMNLFGQSVEDVPMDRYRGPCRWLGRGPSDGDVGAPSGTASLRFRNWALRRPSHGLASNFIRTMV